MDTKIQCFFTNKVTFLLLQTMQLKKHSVFDFTSIEHAVESFRVVPFCSWGARGYYRVHEEALFIAPKR